MATLVDPQVPSPGQADAPKNWRDLVKVLTHKDNFTQSLVQYLQTYLKKVKTAVVGESQYGTLAALPPPTNSTNLYHAVDVGHFFMDEQVGGTPTWVRVAPASNIGTQANRPAAGNGGDFYYASDFQTLYEDNGSAWVPIASRFFFEPVIAPATTFALPAALGSMVQYAIKNNAGGPITVTPNGADTIDGNPSYTVSNNGAVILIDAASGLWAGIAKF